MSKPKEYRVDEAVEVWNKPLTAAMAEVIGRQAEAGYDLVDWRLTTTNDPDGDSHRSAVMVFRLNPLRFRPGD